LKNLTVSRARRRTPPKKLCRPQPNKDFSRLVRRAGQSLLARQAQFARLRQSMISVWYQTPCREIERRLKDVFASLPNMAGKTIDIEGDPLKILLATSFLKEAITLFDLLANFPGDTKQVSSLIAETSGRLEHIQPKPLLDKLGEVSDQNLQKIIDFLINSISDGRNK